MARTKKERTIQIAPSYSGFKPIGGTCNEEQAIVLFFEEYEAIKLCDYEMLPHVGAAKKMNVSRPTFTRIYESARRKIAQAFVEACCIQIEGGKAVADVEWLTCEKCGIKFTVQEEEMQSCPICDAKHKKIAVALETDAADSKIHALFGRCNWFYIFDTASYSVELIQNSINLNDVMLTCPAAESIIENGIQLAVANGFSPRTIDVLLKNKIRLVMPEVEVNLLELLDKLKVKL